MPVVVKHLPIATPEKWMSLSSPIITSSISLQLPSFTSSGWSKVDAISPPTNVRSHRSQRAHNESIHLTGGWGVWKKKITLIAQK